MTLPRPESPWSGTLNSEEFFGRFESIFEVFITPIIQFLGIDSPTLMFLGKISHVFSFILFIGVVYVAYKYITLRKEEGSAQLTIDMEALRELERTNKNTKWEKVAEHMDHESEAEWRLAILEADNLLGDMLRELHFKGETIGEKLTSADPSGFLTLQKAWEAHKVRNQIAHEGSSLRLTKREAMRIIGLYRNVFEEFHYI